MAEIGAREGDEFKAIGTAPSINKTPVGSAMVPVAYPVLHDLTNSVGLSKTTRFNDKAAYLFDMSKQTSTTGDEAGVGKGVRSGTVDGEVKPTKGSKSFRIEGKPVVRANDPCTLNGGNCNGIFVTVAAPSGAIAGGKPTHDTDPPKQLTPEQKKAWYEKTWDAVKDAGKWAKDEASSAAHQVGAALKSPIEGVEGFGKDIANTATEAGNLFLKAGYAQAQSDLAHDAAMTSLTNSQAASEMSQMSQEMAQHPEWAAHVNEPFTNLTDAEKGGAIISNFSPKGLGKALIVGSAKMVGKDAAKVMLKDGEKALLKDGEKAAVKDGEQAAAKDAEKTGKETPHEPEKHDAPESKAPESAPAGNPPGAKIKKKVPGPCDHLRQGNGKGKYRGGAHSKTSKPANDGKDSHHMPADDVSPLARNDGPAIQMDPKDHKLTKSNGSQPGSAKYRQTIEALLDQGKWREAMKKEIHDVRRIQNGIKQPRKYNEAMLEMLEYFKCLEKNGLLK